LPERIVRVTGPDPVRAGLLKQRAEHRIVDGLLALVGGILRADRKLTAGIEGDLCCTEWFVRRAGFAGIQLAVIEGARAALGREDVAELVVAVDRVELDMRVGLHRIARCAAGLDLLLGERERAEERSVLEFSLVNDRCALRNAPLRRHDGLCDLAELLFQRARSAIFVHRRALVGFAHALGDHESQRRIAKVVVLEGRCGQDRLRRRFRKGRRPQVGDVFDEDGTDEERAPRRPLARRCSQVGEGTGAVVVSLGVRGAIGCLRRRERSLI
jgi:hypothetical protein